MQGKETESLEGVGGGVCAYPGECSSRKEGMKTVWCMCAT